MSAIFRGKLQQLSHTASLVDVDEKRRFAAALLRGAERPAVAIGSGGSAISAAFFAACRRDVATTFTVLASPMEFVVGTENLSQCQVWLFSGRADNADIAACLTSAASRNAAEIHLVTSNPDGRASTSATTMARCEVHHSPVADPKDGFLSTHSLVAAMALILGGTDDALGKDTSPEVIVDLVKSRVRREHIESLGREFASISRRSTLVVLADPFLSPAATALETSIWECALCSVQRTDMRNFAHGRHVLASKYPHDTHILAMSTAISASVWEELRSALPNNITHTVLAYGIGSRVDVATAILDALAIVEALGNLQAVDPGKPGVGEFGKRIYEGTALESLAGTLNESVRHKLTAARKYGPSDISLGEMSRGHSNLVSRLSHTVFEAVLLDYDGTLVTTEGRYSPPSNEVVEQLSRVLEGGVMIGIATGRGGSVGADLRGVLPSALHDRVMVGYYNGGHIRPLSVDIEGDPPPHSSVIDDLVHWLDQTDDLPANARHSNVQISIALSEVPDMRRLGARIGAFPGFIEGHVRVARSKHSIDIGPDTNTKLNVRRAIAAALGKVNVEALCIGDSGHAGGNDYDLLGGSSGISVDTVSHQVDSCWSLFGERIKGPSALTRILAAIVLSKDGTFRLALGDLTD